jgi:flagellar biosynthesis protein FliQ
MPFYLQLLHHALATETAAIAPAIIALLVIGTGSAILQAALQLEDATFSLLLKTMAIIVLLLFGSTTAIGRFEALATCWIGHAGELVQTPWS